jgi:hypothetical protein
VQHRGAVAAALELREGSGADRAASVRTGCLGAARAGADASHVEEQAHLVDEVKFGVLRTPKAHVALLVMRVLAAVESSAAAVSRQAAIGVGIEPEVAGL